MIFEDEYISKKEAIIAVTRDGCTANVVGVLYHLPTADVVAVVRCKDCKHRRTAIRCGLWCGSLGENEYFVEHGDDFYCSYGERKE